MRNSIVSLVIVSLVFGGPLAYAQDMAAVLTDTDIAAIRTNCVNVQATLDRIHSSDALARVNLGQQYETIATKLMAPMNSRVALNRLNGIALTQTTVAFNSKLEEFRSLYQQYDQTLVKAIEMRCTDQPVAFYDTLNLARTHRAAVREVVVSMSGLVTQYGSQAQALQQSIKESGK